MQASELTVIAGFRRGAKNDNSSSTSLTERNVVSIIPHNKFTKTTFDSDIAVLKVVFNALLQKSDSNIFLASDCIAG